MYEMIPDELKALPRWVCWKAEVKQASDGTPHLSKIPINPRTGGMAQSDNPQTWGDFDTAVRASPDFAGIGFMFFNSGYIGIDVDDRPGELSEFQSGITENVFGEISESLKTYAETSQSGNGMHFIGRGKLPGKDFKNSSKGIEMYAGKRFFVMTGNACAGYTAVRDITEPVKTLYDKYKTKHTGEEKPLLKRILSAPSSMSAQELIHKAGQSRNGENFMRLYAGDFSDYHSQSEADLAFCNMLAFWAGGDPELIDEVFRSSGLMRDKWDRKQSGTTYGALTIQRAIADTQNTYTQANRDFSIKIGGGDTVLERTFDDIGNSIRMQDLIGDNVRYCYPEKRWYYYDSGKWIEDNSGYMYRCAEQTVQRMLEVEYPLYEQKQDDKLMKKLETHWQKSRMYNGQTHMIEMLKSRVPVLPSEFDKNPMRFACKNGVIDLQSGELLPHSREMMISKQSPVEYSKSAGDPQLWLKFLDEIFNHDLSLIKYIQRCIGYSLTGKASEQCAFFLFGNGRNGKSTFLDVIRYIFGDYASNIQAETLTAKQKSGGAPTSDIARLRGERLVTSSEPDEGMRLAEGLLKQLTGEEPVTARRLYGEEFEFKPEFKLWMATNHKPRVVGTDDGIWRRIHLIPFTVQIPTDKVDKELKYKLIEEAHEILRWAVEGCMNWQKFGLVIPEAVEKAREDYKKSSNVVSIFIDSCCVKQSGARVAASNLYHAYAEWCDQNNEYKMSGTRFGTEIAKLDGVEKKRGKDGLYYYNIKIT